MQQLLLLDYPIPPIISQVNYQLGETTINSLNISFSIAFDVLLSGIHEISIVDTIN